MDGATRPRTELRANVLDAADITNHADRGSDGLGAPPPRRWPPPRHRDPLHEMIGRDVERVGEDSIVASAGSRCPVSSIVDVRAVQLGLKRERFLRGELRFAQRGSEVLAALQIRHGVRRAGWLAVACRTHGRRHPVVGMPPLALLAFSPVRRRPAMLGRVQMSGELIE
jgi:hypothetical protein